MSNAAILEMPRTIRTPLHSAPTLPANIAKVTFEFELIDAERASAYLRLIYAGQRKYAPQLGRKYAQVMTEGRWCTSPDSIAFDLRGRLIEGQHRLGAVVATGIPQWFLVTRGWGDETYGVLGQGKNRTVTDLDSSLTREHAAIARVLRGAPSRQGEVDRPAVVRVAEQHREVIDLVLGWFKGNKIVTAVSTALIRAVLCGKDQARLQLFAEMMVSGRAYAEGDTAVLALRDVMIRERQRGGKVQEVMYRKATSAIDAFCRHQPLTKVYATDRDIFPYPTNLK